MKPYKLSISKIALLDIQDATKWYNKRVPNLGFRFQKSVKQDISTLKANANLYRKRYQNVHCMPIKKFPYLIHFTIDDVNLHVEVFAVAHTSRNPEIWEERNNQL